MPYTPSCTLLFELSNGWSPLSAYGWALTRTSEIGHKHASSANKPRYASTLQPPSASFPLQTRDSHKSDWSCRTISTLPRYYLPTHVRGPLCALAWSYLIDGHHGNIHCRCLPYRVDCSDHLIGPTEASAYGQPNCLHFTSTSILISASIPASGCNSGFRHNAFRMLHPLARLAGLLAFCVRTCAVFRSPCSLGEVFVVCYTCIIYICILLTPLLLPVMHCYLISLHISMLTCISRAHNCTIPLFHCSFLYTRV